MTRLSVRPNLAWAIFAAGLAAAIGFFLLRAALVARLPDAGPSALQGLVLSLGFTFHAWSLAAAYVAMMLLALRTRAGARSLGPLAAVGRTALTNYLMQAALIVPV